MGQDRDQELARRFAALRSEDEARAPSFERTVGAARRRPRSSFAAWAAAAAAASAVAALLLVARSERPVAAPSPTERLAQLEGWSAPSDQFFSDLDPLAGGEPLATDLASFDSPTADLLDLAGEAPGRVR